MATLYFYPDTDESALVFTPNTGSDDYAVVDDPQGSSDGDDTYLVGSGTIGSTSDGYGYQIRIGSAGQEELGAEVDLSSSYEGYDSGEINTTPGTATAWEPDDVRDLHFGVQGIYLVDSVVDVWLSHNDSLAALTGATINWIKVHFQARYVEGKAPYDGRVTQIYVEVNYEEGGPTTETRRVAHTAFTEAVERRRVSAKVFAESVEARRVAHSLVAVPKPTASADRYDPTADSANTVGNWKNQASSSTDLYASVDEYTPVDEGDYVSIAYGNIVAGESTILFETTSEGSDTYLGAHQKLRVRVRVAAFHGEVCLHPVIGYDGTVYDLEDDRSISETFNYKRDVYWDIPTPATVGLSGSDWSGYKMEDISFGVLIHDCEVNGYPHIYNCFVHAYGVDGDGEGDSSALNKIFPADSDKIRDSWNNAQTATYESLWINVREDNESVYISDSSLAANDSLQFGTAHDDSDQTFPEIYGLRLRWKDRSDSATTRGFKFRAVFNTQTYNTDEYSYTNTSWEEHTIDMPLPGAESDWGTPYSISWGLECTTGNSSPCYICYMRIEFYYNEVSPRLAHKVKGDGIRQARVGHKILFETFDAPWWDADYKRREPIEFNGAHDVYEVGDTARVPVYTGYETKIASNGAANESVVHAGRMLFEFKGRVYACWLGDASGSANYSCWFRVKDESGVWGEAVEGFDAGASDVHYYPTITIDSTGVLHCFYGAHNTALKYQRTGTSGGYPNMSFSAQSNIGTYTTYPRPICLSNDDLVVFYRSGDASVKTKWQVFVKSTNGGDSWSAQQTYATYEDNVAQGGAGTPSLYCGGVYVDVNDRIYTCLCFWDGYLSINKGRAVSVQYTDDLVDWYAMDGTQIADTGSSDYIQWDDFEDPGTAVDFCLMAGSVPSGNADDQHADWLSTGPYTHNNNESLIVDKRGYPHCVFTLWTTDIEEACELVICSWNGSSWDYTKLNELDGGELAYHRRSGVAYTDNTTIYVYSYSEPPTGSSDEYFGAEIIRYQGSNYGATWTPLFMTRNTSHGLGMMSVLQDKVGGQPRAILMCRGRDVYYLDDLFYPYVLRNGNDVRVIRTTLHDGSYTHTEQERLPDRFQAEDTEINFMLDTRISASKTNPNGQSQLWFYMNNYLASAPTIDVDLVFRFFDGFEAYASSSQLNSQGGWTGNATTEMIVYHYEDQATNKVFSGAKSVYFNATVSVDTYAEQDLSSDPLDRHEILFYHWWEGGSASSRSYFELLDTTSGNEFAIAFGGSTLYKRQNQGAWSSVSEGMPVTAYNKIMIRIDTDGVSVWVNDESEIVDDTTITQATHIRIGSGNTIATAQRTFFDHITIRGIPDTEGTPETGTPEITETTVTYPRMAQLVRADRQVEQRVAMALKGDKAFWARVQHKAVGEKHSTNRMADKVIAEVSNSVRAAATVSGDKTTIGRVAQRIATDKEFQIRLCHALLADRVFVSRICNRALPEKTVVNRIAQTLIPEVDARRRVANILISEVTMAQRICNALGVEASEVVRVMASLLTDRHLHVRVANAIKGEVELQARITNAVLVELSESARVAHTLDLQRLAAIRVAQTIAGDKEMYIRIANRLAIEGFPEHRVAMLLDVEAVDVMRLAMDCVTEQHIQVRLAQLLVGELPATSRVAMGVDAEQDVRARLAQLLSMSHAVSVRLSNDLATEATSVRRLAMAVAVEVETIRRVANRLAVAAGDTIHLANILQMEAGPTVRVMNTLAFAPLEVMRFANEVAPEATAWNRIANSLLIESTIQARLMQYLQPERVDASRFASSSILEAIDYSRVANIIAGEMAAVVRVGNVVAVESTIRARLAHALGSRERTTGVRMASLVMFIAAVQGAYVSQERIRRIGINRETLDIVGITAERMKDISIGRERMSVVGIDAERVRAVTIGRQRMLLSNDNRIE